LAFCQRDFYHFLFLLHERAAILREKDLRIRAIVDLRTLRSRPDELTM
jgi:hypothetical protein